jgi:phospholipid-binding lipoprotein MlaA
MDRPTVVSRALLTGALALCAHAAFAQDVLLPSASTTVAPINAAPVDAAAPVDIASPTSIAAPSTVSVPSDIALPADNATTAAPAATDVPTDAEQDFQAIYGTGTQDDSQYYDPNLPVPADLPQAFDPWEGFNRRVHTFNNAVDRAVAKPLAKAYMAVVPRPIRLGVSNFFSNLGQPLTMVNSLLQGRPKQAAQTLGRFALNTTLGIGGIFDPATEADLPRYDEDFGQTLGQWGWKRSRYVEVPFFGPRTVRDLFGMAGDANFGLLRGVEEDKVRVFLQGLQLVDVRTQLLSVDAMREGAADDYSLVRDAWLQRRNYQIFGDRALEEDESLPDYLRDDSNPEVPVDAIPVTPMDGG